MQTLEFAADMGKVNITAEMVAELKGLPLAEQMGKYEVEIIRSTSGADRAQSKSEIVPPDKCYAVRSIIVKNDIMVGVEFMGRFGRVYGFLDEYCNIEHSTYYDPQNSQTHSTDCVLRWKGE